MQKSCGKEMGRRQMWEEEREEKGVNEEEEERCIGDNVGP